MRFRALADLGDAFLFSALGIGVFAAVAGTLASQPELPPSAAPTVDDVELASMGPMLVDISMFASAPAPEPEPEEPALAEVLGAELATPVVATVRGGIARPSSPEAKAVELVAPTKPARPEGKRRGCTEPPDALIEATGTDTWVVRKGVVQRYTKDWSKLDDLGWSTPHDGADGRGDGMRLGGIRCGSDVYDAGFRSGDVIHSVNGRMVKSIPQALLVYAAVHNDDVFEVAITRRGERRTLTYQLR